VILTLKIGDVYRYKPTGTVGKVMDIREREGAVWALLDYTNLYYDVRNLEPAPESEYRSVSYKETEKDQSIVLQSVEQLQKVVEEVNIDSYTPSGGG
jgi:hypothetical protein